MPWKCEQILYEKLAPANSEAEYRLHTAALEWNLTEPIIINGREDIKSTASWLGRFDPFEHQVDNLIKFGRDLPVTLLADDVGLGKTISAGLILAELMVRKRVTRALIVCPSVLGMQWVEELKSKFNISAQFVKGAELDRHLINPAKSIVVTTYESFRDRLEALEVGQFDMIILDEAHKLRNLHGTPHPPVVAQKLKAALEARMFKFVLMLTATPMQNRVWDLYSLIDLLTTAKGHQNPLGTPEQFRSRFLADLEGRKLKPETAEAFRTIARQYIRRTSRKDTQMKFPVREVRTRSLKGSHVEKRMAEIAGEHIETCGAFVQISLAQAMMSSPQALAKQLENMAGKQDSVPSHVVVEARRLADANPVSSKLEALLILVRELPTKRPTDWRLVVFTTRRATQDAIARALKDEDISVGLIRGAQPHANQLTVERYRANPPEVNVIVSTDAGSEGINLQAGNVLVNYDLPWNPMVLEQRIGRIQRLASLHAEVSIINLVIAGSVEERVVGRLMEKLTVISQSVGDIEAILESTKQDDEGSFEEMIRKLVVDSLKGQNVEEATRLATASIERGRIKMDIERNNTNSALGEVRDDPSQGARMPKIEAVPPSMDSCKFVMAALAAEGATVEPREDGSTFNIRRSGQANEWMTFKAESTQEEQTGYFGGNHARVYVPGSPPFEQLVQRWMSRSGHCVRDLSLNSDAHTAVAVKTWCDGLPGAAFESFKITDTQSRTVGELLCRVEAINQVDRFERLIRIGKTSTETHGFISAERMAEAPLISRELIANTFLREIDQIVQNAATTDSSIDGFCHYYEERRRKEIIQAGTDERRRHKVETDFAPKVFVKVVGMTGVQYDVAKVQVSFLLDGDNHYDAVLELIPASGNILSQPVREKCGVTGRELPQPCIRKCAISGELCTAHLLVKSSVSDRRALPQHVVKCEISDKTALSDEVWKSDLTGKVGIFSFFQESPIDGRKGIIAEDFVECQMTGVKVLKDELIASELSGKSFRRDQTARSAISDNVGHVSEFSTCEVTGVFLSSDEAGTSSVSGKVVRLDLLVQSEKEPYRSGLSDETVQCSATQKTLLTDEVVTSAVSGRVFDRTLVRLSDWSGQPALAEELVKCEVTSESLLPKETDLCAMNGRRVRKDLLSASPVNGRLGLVEEFVGCEITGAQVLSDELLKSDESGVTFRKDEAVISGASGRIGHRSEMVVCCGTQQLILKSEAGASALTGKLYLKSLMHRSDKSPNRRGTEIELVKCAKSGRRLLTDEVAESCLSGRLVDRDLLRPSQRSQKLALPEELVTCEESGRVLLPVETGLCAITGLRVDTELLRRSAISEKVALKTRMERCAVSNKRVLPSELAECEMTGQRVCPAELKTCSVSQKRAVHGQFIHSHISHKAMLPDYAIVSPVTNRCCTPLEAKECSWRNVKFPSDEVSICRLTGLYFSRDFINEANEFSVLRELLDGKEMGTDAGDVVPWLSTHVEGILHNIKAARCIFSPDGSVRAICVEMRFMLGMRIRYGGLLISEKGERETLGRSIVGKRAQGVWVAG